MRRINQAYLLISLEPLFYHLVNRCFLIRFYFHEYSLQVPIANAKLQLLQKFTWKISRWKDDVGKVFKDHKVLAIYTKLPVLHEIKSIEDIKVLFLGKHLKWNNWIGKKMKKWHQDFLKIEMITKASPMRSTHGVAVDTL